MSSLGVVWVSFDSQVDIIGGLSAGFNVGVIRLLRLAKIARALSSSHAWETGTFGSGRVLNQAFALW